MAAEFADADVVNRMIMLAHGLVSLALPAGRCAALGIDPIPTRDKLGHGKEFTVSIEARDGVETGISAADRARTVAVACDPSATPGDLRRPGHVFPLLARDGGMLERDGVGEAAIDLVRIAGLGPAALLCDLLDEEGRHLNAGVALRRFGAEWGMQVVATEQIFQQRMLEAGAK